VSEDNPGHAHFVQRYQDVLVRIRGELDLLRENGVIDQDADTETFARLIVAVMDGLQIQWLLDAEYDMQATFRAFTDLLLSKQSEPRARANGSLKRAPKAGSS